MSDERIAEIEAEFFRLNAELVELRAKNPGRVVDEFSFATIDGTVSLSEMFGQHEKLLVIHNMGQGCRYCTIWADGINALLPHLESAMSVVLVSKDDPETQRRFANSRGWRFRMASHGGGEYMQAPILGEKGGNHPGAACYEKDGDKIVLKNTCLFGPGDIYCAAWGLLGLAGLDEKSWTPQYEYWRRPEKLDDGGLNILG